MKYGIKIINEGQMMKMVEVINSKDGEQYQITVEISENGLCINISVLKGLPPNQVPVLISALPDDVRKEIGVMVRALLKKAAKPRPPENDAESIQPQRTTNTNTNTKPKGLK